MDKYTRLLKRLEDIPDYCLHNCKPGYKNCMGLCDKTGGFQFSGKDREVAEELLKIIECEEFEILKGAETCKKKAEQKSK